MTRFVAPVWAVLLLFTVAPPAGAQSVGAGQVAACDVPEPGAGLPVDVPVPHTVATGAGVGIALVDTGASSPGVVPGRSGDPAALSVGADTDGDHCALHGTAVAGVLHALAPDAVIVSHRQATEGGVGTVAGLVDALERAVRHARTSELPRVRIINMSLVACQDTAELRSAVSAAEEAGLLLVAAAGNSGQCPADQPPFPASLPGVLTVGGVDTRATTPEKVADLGQGRRKADYSAPGPWVDISAPGGPVSTVLDTPSGPVTVVGDPEPFIGTSFAAPVVSATAALVWQVRPELSAAAVRELLIATAQPGAVPVIDPAAAVAAAMPGEPDTGLTARTPPWAATVDPGTVERPGADLRVPAVLVALVVAGLFITVIRRRPQSVGTVLRARASDSSPPSGSGSMTRHGTDTGRSPSRGTPSATISSGDATM